MQQDSELMRLLVNASQTLLLNIGELRADSRGNREAMLQQTCNIMERFDRRIEDQATRFDDRVRWLAMEIFQQLKRDREDRQKLEGRLRDAEMKIGAGTSATHSWRQMIWGMVKTVGVRQVAAMLLAMVLTSLGIMSAGELVAWLRQQFGL